MKIFNMRPGGVGRTVARFDVQITDDLRIMNVRLVDSPRGRRVYAAHALGVDTATFSPALAEKLTHAANAEFARVSGELNAA